MRAAVLEAPGRFSVREIPDPVVGERQVLVRTAFVSICGSDLHVFHGEFGARVKFPAVLGHEFCGTVEAVGKAVEGFAPGDRVVADPLVPCGRCPSCEEGLYSACRRLKLLGIDLQGGHAELVAVAAERVYRLPGEVRMEHAAVIELYSVAVHAVRRARVEPGDTVVLLGTGRLGLAILDVLALTSAARIVAVDVDDSRLAVARRLGAECVVNARERDPIDAVRELTGGDGAERVIEAIGHWEKIDGRLPPMAQAVEMVRNGGRITVLGQGNESCPIAFKPFVWKEAEIVASRVSRGEFPRAVRLVAEGRLHPAELITHRMPIGSVQEAFERSDAREKGMIKVLLQHGAS
jgi:2-desacetyl-2-hydroxyethyl bacteriochlorophyllide A dehydrogenase